MLAGCGFVPAGLHLNENVVEAERSSTKGPGDEGQTEKKHRVDGHNGTIPSSNGFDILYMPEDSKHCVIISK